MGILKDIENQVAYDKTPLEESYQRMIYECGEMLRTRKMSREQIIIVCSVLIRIYKSQVHEDIEK